jgi:hypothetical protein
MRRKRKKNSIDSPMDITFRGRKTPHLRVASSQVGSVFAAVSESWESFATSKASRRAGYFFFEPSPSFFFASAAQPLALDLFQYMYAWRCLRTGGLLRAHNGGGVLFCFLVLSAGHLRMVG